MNTVENTNNRHCAPVSVNFHRSTSDLSNHVALKNGSSIVRSNTISTLTASVGCAANHSDWLHSKCSVFIRHLRLPLSTSKCDVAIALRIVFNITTVATGLIEHRVVQRISGLLALRLIIGSSLFNRFVRDLR